MPIVVKVLYLNKIIDDNTAAIYLNKPVDMNKIYHIINYDCDIYDAVSNNIILKFRKKRLAAVNAELFYDATIKHALKETNNRGGCTGSEYKSIYTNDFVKTNVLGYMYGLSPSQKVKYRNNILLCKARPSSFNSNPKNRFNLCLPLLKEINNWYKNLTPIQWALQKQESNKSLFTIEDTCFTTVTTNINFQTTNHTDKNNYKPGFACISVVKNDEYTGGELCLLQYGIAVDIRYLDILIVDVNLVHSNNEIVLNNDNSIRYSIVCYLRPDVINNTTGMDEKSYNEQVLLFSKK